MFMIQHRKSGVWVLAVLFMSVTSLWYSILSTDVFQKQGTLLHLWQNNDEASETLPNHHLTTTKDEMVLPPLTGTVTAREKLWNFFSATSTNQTRTVQKPDQKTSSTFSYKRKKTRNQAQSTSTLPQSTQTLMVVVNASHNDHNAIGTTSTTTTTTSATTSPTTLALLFPTGLTGGYRNQAMRFTAFVKHALDQQVSQLLLPSLLWSTRYPKSNNNHNYDSNFFWPVPFEELFDVKHWNSFHRHVDATYSRNENNDNNNYYYNSSLISLPLLVDSISNSDCWKEEPFSTLEMERILRQLHGDGDVDDDNPLPQKNITTMSGTYSIRNGKQKWDIPKLMDTVVTRSTARLLPTANISLDYLSGRLGTSFRKLDFRDKVKHCHHPKVYGGGKGAGVLWNDYMNIPKLELNQLEGKHGKTETIDPQMIQKSTQLIATLHQALIPAPRWRQLASQCIQHHLLLDKEPDNAAKNTNNNGDVGYAVLHARVEPEMLRHKCGRDMEKNLTNIFGMVDEFLEIFNLRNSRGPRVMGTMIAVGREQISKGETSDTGSLWKYNWDVLNERSMSFVNGTYIISRQLDVTTGVSGEYENSNKILMTRSLRTGQKLYRDKLKMLPMFECGESYLEAAFYNDSQANGDHFLTSYYGNTLPSIINFWLAVQADVFIGVMKSSWSTDVWTTRYYQGKRANFQYTSEHGVIPVPNGGLPPYHENC